MMKHEHMYLDGWFSGLSLRTKQNIFNLLKGLDMDNSAAREARKALNRIRGR
jgi:hypothetical protein